MDTIPTESTTLSAGARAVLADSIGKASPPGGWLDEHELSELTNAALNELHRLARLRAEAGSRVQYARLRGDEEQMLTARGQEGHYQQRFDRLREAIRILQSCGGEGCKVEALPDARHAEEQEREQRAWLQAEERVIEAAREENAWPPLAVQVRDDLAASFDGCRVDVRAASETDARLTLQGYIFHGVEVPEEPVGDRYIFEFAVNAGA